MRRFLLIPLLCAGLLTIPGAPTFVAVDLETGARLACEPLGHGERVVLVFTHSMYGGDVREEYVAGSDGRLRRVEMTTANAAAAEYYAHDGRVTRLDDRFRVDAPPASFDEIVVRVDDVGRHRLLRNGGELDLLAAVGQGTPVRLDVVRLGPVDRWTGGGCG
jgi:hypothetical protein